MKILILEDEPQAARSLAKDLGSVSDTDIDSIEICNDLESARQRLDDKDNIELLFLDLNIHGESGFEILKEFASKKFDTIIISAYSEFALEAFDYGVLDYIVKPVSIKRLSQALSRYRAFDSSKEDKDLPSLKHLMVKERDGYLKIDLSDLLLVRSAGDYSELYLVDGDSKLSSKSMDFLERRLPSTFVRVHRTAIVRVDLIKELKIEGGGRYSLKIKGLDIEIPVGRSKYKQLKDSIF